MRKSSVIKILFFTLVYLTLSSLVVFYFHIDRKNRIALYLQQKINKLHSEFRATKNTYKKLSNFVYDELTNTDTFMKLLRQAWQTDEAKERLHAYLQPYFSILQRYDIYYLSILSPTGDILVNMHKPLIKTRNRKRELFGKKRESELVIEFKKPIYLDGNILGLFQTAISYNILKRELQRLFHGYYEYIIKSDLINKNIFKYGNYLFVQSDLDSRYFYEESSLKQNGTKAKQIVHAINRLIRQKAQQRLDSDRNFALIAKLGKDYYTVTFLAISSQNHNLGYLISYKKDANIAVFDTIFWENVLLSNVLILLILGFIAYMLHTKERFEKMAITDKLTGLYNRYKFYSVAQQELDRSKRHKHPFSLIIFDIDHFKKINDTYGHDVGDRVLKTVAKLVRKNVRKYDYVFRWGGEEFIILAPETDINGALKLAEKIRTIIASHHFAKIGHVTISAGIAQFVEDIDKGIDSVVKRADNALYLAKHEGRNRSRIAL